METKHTIIITRTYVDQLMKIIDDDVGMWSEMALGDCWVRRDTGIEPRLCFNLEPQVSIHTYT